MDFDFDEVFGDDYLHFYQDLLTEERSDQETQIIVRLLGLQRGMRVLDVPCGHGRIANRLSALGYVVVGVDSNARFLDVARQQGRHVDYRQADMREFVPSQGAFDAIINWFTSFGYFDKDTDKRILRGWHRALKHGGKLLIDHPNAVQVLGSIRSVGPHLVRLTERSDDLLIDRTDYDHISGRANTERISVRSGNVRRYRFSVRFFTLAELRDWLLEAGFREVMGYGYEGEDFNLNSRRLIVVAEA